MQDAVTRWLLLRPLPSQDSSLRPRNLEATYSSKAGPRACYPASCLLRSRVPVPQPHRRLHHTPCISTLLPQVWRLPPLVLGRLS